MTRQRFYRLTLTVIFPLLIGGLTYILFRVDSLVMFRWLDTLGLDPAIKMVRQLTGHLNVPAWIVFSLPDALWVFSFTNLMLIVWQDKISEQSILWIFIAPAIGLLLEFGQAFHYVSGTFDRMDLLLILIVSILPFISTIYKLKSI